jgi:hypothetical protein
MKSIRLGQEDSSDMNGDYPNWMFATPGFSSFDPLANATQIATFESQQPAGAQITTGVRGQGGVSALTSIAFRFRKERLGIITVVGLGACGAGQ